MTTPRILLSSIVTSINDKIEPTKEDIIAVAVKAGLNEKKAIEILKSIEVIIL